jgi:hypothetical protein
MNLGKFSRRVVAVPMPAPPRELPAPVAKQSEPVGKT